MISFDIKNIGRIDIQNLVLDLNGTISCDGILVNGIFERIQKLKTNLNLYLISADTLGTAKKIAEGLDIILIQLNHSNLESDQKAAFIESINPKITAAIGNGQNDTKMLKLAQIGIGIIGAEGMVAALFFNAKVVVNSPLDALDLFLHPKRMIATLRD